MTSESNEARESGGYSGDADTETADWGAVQPYPRLRNGMRVAVLAGVITLAGSVTTGLSSPINSLAGPMDTTCCGSSQVVHQGSTS
jgi:hypothetical protein